MNLSAEVWIDAPPAAVWARVAQPAAWPMIVPFLTSAELVEPAPLAVGARVRCGFEQGGRQLLSEAEVSECTPPSRLTLHARVPDVQLDVQARLDLAPEGTGTRVRQATELRFDNPFLRAMGEGLVRARNPEAQQQDGLNRLKRAVEGAA